MSTFAVGDKVFFLHPEESWVLGEVTSVTERVTHGGTIKSFLYSCEAQPSQAPGSAQLEETSISDLPESSLHQVVSVSRDKQSSNETFDDLLEMSYLHDSTLLQQVRVRYFQNTIYTHIGPIILALNPYDYHLPNYVDSNMPKYLSEGDEVVRSRSANIPHAWTTAHYAFWLLRTNEENQSIIVTGESGAGKTETAKIVLRYLGIVSTQVCAEAEREQARTVTLRVNLTSPILEAFGNAKTKRNDNSSRFGKFMKVHFSRTSGAMIGSEIEVYLLEKSRIVTHADDERSYHSFYQLLAGAPTETIKQLRLQPAQSYKSLAEGRSIEIDGVNDGDDFRAVCEAMDILKMTADTQRHVWETVAGVLHALSLRITAASEDDSVVDTSPENELCLENVEKLWCINGDKLAQELVATKTKLASGEEFVRKMRLSQAIDARDALCKVVYERLFIYLVDRINDSVNIADVESPRHKKDPSWIGLLDIFGFEHFEKNSFEQMCINLANETLQNHYNTIIFTKDLQECQAEGINTESVVFYDNQPCLDLICGYDFSALSGAGKYAVSEAHTSPRTRQSTAYSLFAMLDEESLLGKGSDLAFCEKIGQRHGGTIKNTTAHANFVKPKTERNTFIIKHYAYDVKYCVDGFREKNLDTLKGALKDVMRASTEPFIAALFGESSTSTVTSSSGSRVTVSSIFKGQLVRLMVELNATCPHWIRCVKPHRAKKPRMFCGAEVMSQLCSAGVLETVRIRKMSFSMRFTFADFWHHFRSILRRQHFVGSEKDSTLEIMDKCGVNKPHLAQVGKTKVFLKTEAYHVVSRMHFQQKTANVTVVSAFVRRRLSCFRARCLQLHVHLFHVCGFVRALTSRKLQHALIRNAQVKLIASFLHFRPSHLVVRHLELKEKEKYLLKHFRGVLLLQSEEARNRADAVEHLEAAELRQIAAQRQAHLQVLHAAWVKQTQVKHSRECAEFEQLETRARHDIANAEQTGERKFLADCEMIQLCQIAMREDVQLEEVKDFAAVEDKLADGHRLVLQELARQRRQKILIELAAAQAEETDARRANVEFPRDQFFHWISHTANLLLAEEALRSGTIEVEAAERHDIEDAAAANLSVLIEQWRFHLDQLFKAAVLALRKEQHAARIGLCKEESNDLIVTLADLEDSFEEAARAECMRLVRAAEAKRECAEAKRKEEDAARRAQLAEQRKKAQQIWRRAIEEEREARARREVQREALVEKLLTAAQTAEYFRECKSLDHHHSAPRLGEAYSHTLTLPSPPRASQYPLRVRESSPTMPFIPDVDEFSPHDPPQRVGGSSDARRASEAAAAQTPRNVTVSNRESSVQTLSRLQQLASQHRGKTAWFEAQSQEKRQLEPMMDANERHRKRKEEVFSKMLSLTAYHQPSAGSPRSGLSHSPSSHGTPRWLGAHRHHHPGLAVFKPRSSNPFSANWCPPSDREVYLPDGTIVPVEVESVQRRKRNETQAAVVEHEIVMSDADGEPKGSNKQQQRAAPSNEAAAPPPPNA